MASAWSRVAVLRRRPLLDLHAAQHNHSHSQQQLQLQQQRWKGLTFQTQQQQRFVASLSESRRFSSSSSSSSTRAYYPRPDNDAASNLWKSLSSRLQEDLSMWLIPKRGTGFDTFFPKNKSPPKDSKGSTEQDAEKKEESGKGEESSSKKKKKSSSSSDNNNDWKNGFNSFRSGTGGGGTGGSGGGPSVGQKIAAAALLLPLFAYLMMRAEPDVSGSGSSSSSSSSSREITWGDFCNHLLETGQVERIVITNNRNMAKVYLKPGAPGLPQQQSLYQTQRHVRYAERRQQHLNNQQQQQQDAQQHKNDDTDDYALSSASSSSDGFSSTSSPSFLGDGSSSSLSTHQQQPQIVYRLAVGTVDAFEKKLEEAQRAVHMDPSHEIPVQYTAESSLARELQGVIPSLLFMGAAFFFMRYATATMMGGGGGGAGGRGGMGGIFQIGKSTAKKINKEDVTINFSNVAGCDEAKKEVMEFVDFLQDPTRFTKLGAKIPKGALLCGPPGTGKTLLAKAVAGEAGVPFYSISGSDFIEMFVGVGPSRVRDLFREARENAPCIIFIDEIDAVGRQRGRGGVGGNDERENTLNQLLVEMDGFETTTGVVVLAGTNRVDILDQALTRPGRFDRQITVDKPDLKGRKDIFLVHLQGITLQDKPEDLAGRLAGLTPGFAGADIANICNEAAIVAARRKGETVSFDDFEKATDRIIGGLESNKLMSKEDRSVVAHHEAGHAVAGWFLEHADPLLKVTIIPRTSGALGFAQYLPKEVFLRTQDQIMDIVCMALAGRAAEEVFFGRVTTGASDDLRRVTDLIYSTIQLYGMNERLGQLSFPKDPNAMFDERRYSEKTAKAMDEEAKRIVDAAYQRTLDLIREKKTEVDKVATMLLDKETITHDDILEVIGPRPYKGDTAYEEFIRRRQVLKEEFTSDDTKDEDNDGEKKADDTTSTGTLNPALA